MIWCTKENIKPQCRTINGTVACFGPHELSSATTLTSGAFKTEDDMDAQEEGQEKSTN